MDYQNRPQRQMNDVSSLGLKCEECGVDIKELPFEPTKRDDGTYGRIYCQECNRKRRKTSGGGGFGGGGFGGGRRDRY